jgi:hypothetical protein
MKSHFHRFAAGTVCFALFAITLSGCHKQAAKAPAPPVEAAQVADVIHDAFHDAPGELQAEAATIEDAARKEDPAAITPLMELLHRPDLTPEERARVSRCLPTLLGAAQKAADQGNQQAAQALSAYRASK